MLCVAFPMKAQNSKAYSILRSNLGISGSSKAVSTSKGTYSISQSIGQSSVIGTSFSNGYYLRQGYQQPINKIKVSDEKFKHSDLSAIVFPNPFQQSVYISFDENIEQDISVLVFDVAGKLMFSKKFTPSQRIQINLDSMSSGSYLLKVISNNKLFNAKLIKN